MTEPQSSRPGSIVWQDLTVADAEGVAAFYAAVVGWDATEHPMGEYADYDMVHPDSGEPVAGICHARGVNADVPPQWMLYVAVADLDASLAACRADGGRVLQERRSTDGPPSAIVRDPAGAVLTLYGVAGEA